MIKYLDISVGEFTNISLNYDEFRLELVRSDKDGMTIRAKRNDVTDMLLMFEDGISNYRCTVGFNSGKTTENVTASILALRPEERFMVLDLQLEKPENVPEEKIAEGKNNSSLLYVPDSMNLLRS